MRRLSRGVALLAIPAAVLFAAPAHADGDEPDGPEASADSPYTSDSPKIPADDPTNEVCTGFNLGMSPGQIAGELERNDGRYNVWRAWRTTVWPIINGACG